MLGGQSVTGMVSVDTMTAPEFQRRGLLTRVGTHTYAQWHAAGIPFVLGLPNERWGSRTNALGWVELCDYQWLARPLRCRNAAGATTAFQTAQKLNVGSALWNGFWDTRLSHSNGMHVQRVTLAVGITGCGNRCARMHLSLYSTIAHGWSGVISTHPHSITTFCSRARG